MTRYRIEIDRDLCGGFGSCEQLAPHLVRLDPQGIATVRVGETDDSSAPLLEHECPMGAITVVALDGSES